MTVGPVLTARERSRLKARAHALEPLVHVGHAGLTDAVVREVEHALAAHELIKVRMAVTDRDEREALGRELATRTDAAEVQRVGKVIVLWRPLPEEAAPGEPG